MNHSHDIKCKCICTDSADSADAFHSKRLRQTERGLCVFKRNTRVRHLGLWVWWTHNLLFGNRMGSHSSGEPPELHDVVLRVFLLHVVIVSLCVKRRPGEARSDKISTSFHEAAATAYSEQLRKARQKAGIRSPQQTTSPPILFYEIRQKSLLTRSQNNLLQPHKDFKRRGRAFQFSSAFLLLFIFFILCLHNILRTTQRNYVKVLGRSETEQSEI